MARESQMTSSSNNGAAVDATSTISLLVCKGFSGEIVRASVELDAMVGEALPLIADQIGYFSPDWERIGLYNLTLDYEYRMDDRFGECRTQDGDLVIMADGAACHK